MHPQRQHEGFGIPGLQRKSAELVVRSFDLGSGVAARGLKLLEGSPLLFVVGSRDDEPIDWLRCGQALERVLLTAASLGMQASFLSQPLHFGDLRSRIRELAPGARVPQILLRVGMPLETLSPVVRRPVGDVIKTDWLEG
jgi:hypothetical protein